jgi:hypothetical protein
MIGALVSVVRKTDNVTAVGDDVIHLLEWKREPDDLAEARVAAAFVTDNARFLRNIADE